MERIIKNLPKWKAGTGLTSNACHLPSEGQAPSLRQVSWLATHPQPGLPVSGGVSGSSSLTVAGAATDSHRFPYYPIMDLKTIMFGFRLNFII
jgi:hypothetical protein